MSSLWTETFWALVKSELLAFELGDDGALDEAVGGLYLAWLVGLDGTVESSTFTRPGASGSCRDVDVEGAVLVPTLESCSISVAKGACISYTLIRT